MIRAGGNGDNIGKAKGQRRGTAPMHQPTIASERQHVGAARGDGHDICGRCRNDGLTIGVVPPNDHFAVALECDTVIVPGCNGHDIGQARRHNGLTEVRGNIIARSRSPGHHGTVSSQCEAMISTASDFNCVGERCRHQTLAPIWRNRVVCPSTPGQHSPVHFESQGIIGSPRYPDYAAEAGRHNRLAIVWRADVVCACAPSQQLQNGHHSLGAADGSERVAGHDRIIPSLADEHALQHQDRIRRAGDVEAVEAPLIRERSRAEDVRLERRRATQVCHDVRWRRNDYRGLVGIDDMKWIAHAEVSVAVICAQGEIGCKCLHCDGTRPDAIAERARNRRGDGRTACAQANRPGEISGDHIRNIQCSDRRDERKVRQLRG